MPKHIITFCLALAGALLLRVPVQSQDPLVDFEPLTVEAFGIEGIVPAGWQTLAPGVVARAASPTDLTTLIQQAAPFNAATLQAQLTTQLNFLEFPAATETIQTEALTWSVYVTDTEQQNFRLALAIALAEVDETSYLIILQSDEDSFGALYERVFLPALEAFSLIDADPATAEATAAPAATVDQDTYTDPDGLYSVTIPNGWEAREQAGYTTLASPDDAILTHFTTAVTDDPYKAIEGAWAMIDPAFDQRYDEADAQDSTDPGLAGDAERVLFITYRDGTDDDGVIVQAIAQVYDGISYVLIAETTLEAAQRRQSQLAVINTGWRILAIAQTDLADAQPLPVDEALIAQLEAYIETIMAQTGTPGLAIAIVQGDAVVYTNGFGVRDLESEAPVLPDTRMMIGSTGKSMTTMLMGTLVDDGLLDWDQAVITILPEFAVADAELTQTITVQNLVCACTGVPRRDLEFLFNASELSAEDVVESLASFEFFTDFGEAFQYSNQLVATGGYVAAAADGAAYGDLFAGFLDAIQTRVFDPIGMTRTTYDFDVVLQDENRAQPYGLNIAGERVRLPFTVEQTLTPIAPAGASWSTAEDMGRYLLAELGRGTLPDGTPIVSQANLERTWMPQVEVTSESDYGLGWFVETWNGIPVIQHGGNTLGFTSDLAFMPDRGIGISVIVNQQGSIVPLAVRERLFELLFAQEADFDAQVQAVLDQAAKAINEALEDLEAVAPEADVATFAGTYRNDALGTIDLSVNAAGTLVLDAGEFQTQLWQVTASDREIRYRSMDAPLAGLDFIFEAAEFDRPRIRFGSGEILYVFVRD